jgi:uncharacterized protein (TIGR00369 family)
MNDSVIARFRGMSGEAYADFVRTDLRAFPPSTACLNPRVVHIDATRGFARFGFKPPEFAGNFMGAIQGGYCAVMLDDVMAMGALAKIGGGYTLPTLDMNLAYLRAAPMGEEVFAEGWLVRRGKTVAFLEGQLLDSQERICTKVSITCMVRERK